MFSVLCSPVNPPTVQPPTVTTKTPKRICNCKPPSSPKGSDWDVLLDVTDFVLFHTVSYCSLICFFVSRCRLWTISALAGHWCSSAFGRYTCWHTLLLQSWVHTHTHTQRERVCTCLCNILVHHSGLWKNLTTSVWPCDMFTLAYVVSDVQKFIVRVSEVLPHSAYSLVTV